MDTIRRYVIRRYVLTSVDPGGPLSALTGVAYLLLKALTWQ